MAQGIPQVMDGMLRLPELPGVAEIEVGTPSWVSWLADPASRSFSFRGYRGTFTARKELRSRGGAYWIAYRKRSGKLRKAYLGKAEDLTLERLEDAAAVLSGTEVKIAADTLSKEPTGGAHRVREGAPTAAEGGSPEGSPQEERGDPVLLTKLSIPTTRSYVVSRPYLSKRLEEGMGCKLTLISAPAGFGKTTLLSAWLSDPSAVGRPVAWLSLDSADNDPARFWRYVVTALARLQPGVGETTLALLGSPQTPPIETVLTTLLNELAKLATDSMLVLDDYHLIESRAIHEALAFMLEHLPPRLHLIIATRADPLLPLSKLRVRGELVELRASELRFATEETAEFFGRSAGVELSAEAVAKLEERTEGWPAGLQIAALAMRDHADVAGFIDTFAGSNRHVVDYLAEEVLERQPEHVRTFLLQTSVLDRMCASLCDAITRHDGTDTAASSGQTMLEHVEHDNLFVFALDEERGWYRYHHLFADVLKQRLSQSRAALLPELHRRASAWFERHQLFPEAIDHALASRTWELAVRLLESEGTSVLARGQVQTVLGWIKGLPEALMRSRPNLCTLQALALLYSNQPDQAEQWLRNAERCVPANPASDEGRVVLGRVATIRGSLARFSGDIERCVVMAHRALELLPETDSTRRERAVAMAITALAYQWSGDATPDTERALEEAAASFRDSGDVLPLLRTTTALARLRTLQGRLRAAAATYEEAAAIVPKRERLVALPNSGAAYYVGLGDIQREWDDLDSAERNLVRGTDMASATSDIDADVVAHGYLSLARLHHARGRHADALATLETYAGVARQRNFVPRLVARGEALRARLLLAQGDLPGATRWAEASGLGPTDQVAYAHEDEHLTLARVLIAQRRNEPEGINLDDTLSLLDRLLQDAEDRRRLESTIEILALRALALHARGERERALVDLQQDLALAEPEGYVRTFVDEGAPMATLLRQMLRERRQGERDQRRRALLGYVRRLLAAFVPPVSIGAEEHGGLATGSGELLPDLLTPREREVLELIAAGLSNKEIASWLFIIPGTVKGYVNIIFKKLGVKTRTQAVAEAHKLGLLSE